MTGTISQLSVRVSRKMGDGDYGSYGVEAEATENIAAGANVQEEFDALDAFLTAAVGMSMTEKKGTIEAAKPEKPVEATEGLGPKPTTKEKPEGLTEEHAVKIVKATLSKRTDGKFELSLYPEIAGNPGKYPEIRYVRERDAMWEMLREVADDHDFSSLPVEFSVEWLAHYVLGKETPKGNRYKDLIAIKAM